MKCSSLQLTSLVGALTCHMGTHSVTCYSSEVTFPPFTPVKLVLYLASREWMQDLV